jgi:predicted nucleic acid-binding protein
MPDNTEQAIIIDTSSLIALSKLKLMHILKDLYAEVIVPESVYYEFAQDLPPWIHMTSSQNTSLVLVLREKLGYGESEVIALGVEKKDFILVLDDRKARQTARRLGLKITGLLGILVKAKKRKKIASIKPLLELLDCENFRISQELKDEILKLAGE